MLQKGHPTILLPNLLDVSCRVKLKDLVRVKRLESFDLTNDTEVEIPQVREENSNKDPEQESFGPDRLFGLLSLLSQ